MPRKLITGRCRRSGTKRLGSRKRMGEERRLIAAQERRATRRRRKESEKRNKRTESRLYVDRTIGGAVNDWDIGGVVIAGVSASEAKVAGDSLHRQIETVVGGDEAVHG